MTVRHSEAEDREEKYRVKTENAPLAGASSAPETRYRMTAVDPGARARAEAQSSLTAGFCTAVAGGEVVTIQSQEQGQAWGAAQAVRMQSCEDADGAENTPAPIPLPSAVQVREEAARLIVEPEDFTIQPPNLIAYVNAENVVVADAGPQTIASNLLGFDVWITATPSVYHWDFGDGSEPLITTDPNDEWPDHRYGFTYRQQGYYHVTLMIEWDAEYSLTGPAGPWTAFDQPLVTTTVSEEIYARNLRSRLVND